MKDGKPFQSRRFLQLSHLWIKILVGCCCRKSDPSFIFYSDLSLINQKIQEGAKDFFATLGKWCRSRAEELSLLVPAAGILGLVNKSAGWPKGDRIGADLPFDVPGLRSPQVRDGFP